MSYKRNINEDKTMTKLQAVCLTCVLLLIIEPASIASSFEWINKSFNVTQYMDAAIDYAIFPWQFSSSQEPDVIDWKFGSVFMMRKPGAGPAEGQGDYLHRVNQVATGRCGDFLYSGCLKLEYINNTDVGQYIIVVTILPANFFQAEANLRYVNFDSSSSPTILNNSCIVKIGSDNILLDPPRAIEYQTSYENTTVRIECDSSMVPAAFISISQATVVIGECLEIPDTQCSSPIVSLLPGLMTITFDYLETWNPVFNISLFTRPQLLQDLDDVTMLIDSTLHINCSFKSMPKADIEWVFNNTEKPSEEAFSISNDVIMDGDFIISSSALSWKTPDLKLRKTVNGIYRCDGYNGIGPVSSSSMMLNVLYAPGQAHIQAVNETVAEGTDSLQLTCIFEAQDGGNPAVYHYHWMNLDTGEQQSWIGNQLIIPSDILNVTRHEGEWQCIANNTIGTSQPGTLDITVVAEPVVLKDLTDETLVINDTLHIECSFRAKPESTITWHYNDTEPLDMDVFDIAYDESTDIYTTSKSVIRWKAGSEMDIRKTVQGMYRCDATNGFGDLISSTTMQLIVQYSPGTVRLEATQTTVVENEIRLLIDCLLDPGQEGFPTDYTYQWRNLDTGEISTEESSQLVIAKQELNASIHEGTWQCTPHNIIGPGVPADIHITVNAKPSIKDDLQDQNVTINRPLLVECSFIAKPGAHISWMYNDSLDIPVAIEVTNNTLPAGVYHISRSKLSWKNGLGQDLKRMASGLYRCVADNDVIGIVNSDTMKLDIQFGPLSIHIGKNETKVLEADPVNRTCSADCNPSCNYVWTNLTSGDNISMAPILDVGPATRYDHGDYRCTADNSIWSNNTVFSLSVFFAPEPEVAITDENNLIQGNSTELKCSVESRPLSDVILKNLTDDSVLITGDNNLAVYPISSVDCLQTGNYSCLATNDIPVSDHFVSETIYMNIKCPPRTSQKDPDGATSVGNNFTFEAHLISNPHPIITRDNWTFIQENDTRSTDLPPNVDINEGKPEAWERHTVVPQLHINEVDVYNFGKYILTTSNQIGGALSLQFVLTPEGPPLKPSKPRLMCRSATSLAINWTAEFNGGFQQTFSVMYSANGGEEEEEDVNHDPDVNKGDIVQHKLQNLDQSTMYSIRIKAMNGFDGGRHTYGDPASFETKEKPMLVAEPVYDFNSTHVQIAMSVLYIQSVNYMIIEMCTNGQEVASCSPEVNVSVTSGDLTVTLQLPEDKANSYEVTINMFDCEDVVNATSLTINVPKKGLSSAAIGGIAGGITALVLIVAGILAFFFIRQKQGKRKQSSRNTDGYVNVGLTNPALILDPISDPASSSHSRILPNSSESSTCIAVSQFPDHVSQILGMENPLEKEYGSLPQGKLFEWEAAVQDDSLKYKNRFRNILPYDQNRVYLSMQDDDPLSDYINASYVDGYSSEDKFIASQGPTSYSVDDFWRMLWEKEVYLIVMLTKCVEMGGKNKCDHYWPKKIMGEPTTCGDINIIMEKESVWPDYTIRSLSVTRNGEKRSLSQCHYTSWPDHGVPDCGTALIAFWGIVTKKMVHGKYTLVHCSAGVGRTGTFIAFDSLTKQAEKEGHVDVFGFVKKLRIQRIHMIQTTAQYVFLHKALSQYFMTGKTVISCPEFNNTFNRIIKPMAGANRLQQQVQMLNKLAPEVRPVDQDYPLDETNFIKNRDPAIIPLLSSRVQLRSRVPGRNDYINAVHVDAYRKKDAFIVTQVPLEDTIIDFWRLMEDFDSSTVVLLVTDQQYKAMPPFIPTPENPFIESNGKLAKLRGLNEKKGYTISDVLFGNVQPTENIYMNQEDLSQKQAPKQHSGPTRNLKLFIVHAAKNIGTIDAATVISAISDVNSWVGNVGDHPITVVCWNGSTYSGQFVACSNLFEMISAEQEVDVFRVVKQIRDKRPQFVPNEEQYKGLHSVVKKYLQDFALYANLI